MPGPLRNSRHEAFVRGLFENKSAHQSYIDAGYKPCRQNAARLTTKDDIKVRLAELQNEAAEQSVVAPVVSTNFWPLSKPGRRFLVRADHSA
jgi:hypothetical protein